jgi:hypothetical protein
MGSVAARENMLQAMRAVARKIGDKRILKLVRRYLQSCKAG